MIVNKEVFLEKLACASRFISQRFSANVPLQGVYLKKQKNKLFFYSTNLSFYFKSEISVKTSDKEKDFSLVIDSKKITEFLSLLPSQEIEVFLQEKSLAIYSKSHQGEFSMTQTDDFPTIKIDQYLEKKKIDLKKLSEISPLIYFAASTDESRPILTGIHFDTLDEVTNLVATDGFRLSLYALEERLPFSSVVIPAFFINEIIRIGKNLKDIDLYFNDKEKIFTFVLDETEISTRVIEGDYPPYERVIPKEKTTEVVVEREDLLRNIKLASIFARDFSNVVLLEIEKNLIRVTPKTSDQTKSVGTLEARVEGEAIKIAFNSKFLIDFLNRASSEEIKIELLRSDSPTVFKMVGNDRFLHIIMPVRVQD
ncbi:MAG: DNA polymerase III subunit beta [Patescibacteria group bacterium]|nr:DNA polymerase III subunit beta [Patescibacteria group bacterium]